MDTNRRLGDEMGHIITIHREESARSDYLVDALSAIANTFDYFCVSQVNQDKIHSAKRLKARPRNDILYIR